MKKRILLFLVVAVVFATAPDAMAVCYRCNVDKICVTGGPFGYQICRDGVGGGHCYLDAPCGSLAGEVEPLAAEFTVASVERLDEPQTAASETLVASIETPPSANR
ncbi:MAG TPA: hypothetical protein VEK57_05580 [Thermoanaerobaculia bacterium]|nr:hypothetical protein [Thermoanaerobaculia bacterium]